MPNSLWQDSTFVFFILLLTIFITPVIARLFHFPKIIGLILAGLLVGPHGLNILPLNQVIELLASIGLMYLMFDAGLEINLDQFIFYRKRTFIFYALTYLIPQLSGIVIGELIGIDLISSILLGAIYASYTLVAYPVISELGVLKNEAVAITVTAVVLTDITALCILTIILQTHNQTPSYLDLLLLCGLTLCFMFFLLLVIPYLGKLFFKFSSDIKIDFLFILCILFASAAFAHLISIQPIVGSFLAGLAVNRMISKESRAYKQTIFLGETLFVPIFIISIGMRLDPLAVFFSQKALLIGVTLTAAVYITKWLAAWIMKLLFNYSWPELWTIWGLSQAQAAATLAIILIATQAKLFPVDMLHGAIIMVICTVFTSPIIVRYFGSQLKASPEQIHPLFNRIMLPITHDDFFDSELELAGCLARFAEGQLLILNLATSKNQMEERREKLRAGPMKDPNTDTVLLNHISDKISDSILKESVESEITCIMMNWSKDEKMKGYVFSKDVDEVIWSSEVPVVACMLNYPIKTYKRVVAVLCSHTIGVKLDDHFIQMVLDIANALELPLTIMTTHHYIEKMQSFADKLKKYEPEIVSLGKQIVDEVAKQVFKEDLLIIPSMHQRNRFKSTRYHIPNDLIHHCKSSFIILHIV